MSYFKELDNNNLSLVTKLVNFDENKDKCMICKNYYIFKNNLCSYCFNGKFHCEKCNGYFTLKKLCKECELEKKYQNKIMSLDEILNLPQTNFKGIKMEEKIEEIFELYLQKTKSSFKCIWLVENQTKKISNLKQKRIRYLTIFKNR